MSQLKPVALTPEQEQAMQVARVGLMSAFPFYCHYFYTEMREMPTNDIPMAATDGRTIYYNPTYLAGLKPSERVFVLAHEVDHVICRHPQRFKSYERDGHMPDGLPVDIEQANVAADYVINAGLLEQGAGTMNPDWLYDHKTTGDMLCEDVYARYYKNKPPGGGNTFGQSVISPKGAKGDPTARGNGGRFDDVLPPSVDPVTGQEDIPDPAEFKEAIARAASAAKAMGNLPASLQRRVAEILEPQVNWRDHVRMLVTGKIGARKESWERPNRRRIVLNPIVIMPGRRGFGAETVAVVVDNSGSITEKELSAYFGEIGAILADVKPRRVMLIWCDAKVRQVDEARSLEDLAGIRVNGSPGGGGTDFRPPFDYLAKEGIVPDTLIYATDMMGRFPDKPPAYPVVWCATADGAAPWGDTVRIKV